MIQGISSGVTSACLFSFAEIQVPVALTANQSFFPPPLAYFFHRHFFGWRNYRIPTPLQLVYQTLPGSVETLPLLLFSLINTNLNLPLPLHDRTDRCCIGREVDPLWASFSSFTVPESSQAFLCPPPHPPHTKVASLPPPPPILPPLLLSSLSFLVR